MFKNTYLFIEKWVVMFFAFTVIIVMASSLSDGFYGWIRKEV